MKARGRPDTFAWALVVLACPAIAFARGASEEVVAESVGRLQEVKNAGGVSTTGTAHGVRIIRAGKSLSPRLGIELRAGDRIVTDVSTQVVIGSEGGPKIFLGINSDLTLRKASCSLTLGSLLLTIKKLFRVETKFVVAGVEGTELALSVGEGDVMALSVLEGAVRLESRTAKWIPRTYTDDQEVIARGEAEPEKLQRDAIRAFHRRDYDTAVALYDRVLLADPENAYLLNLKAYSLFKRKLLGQAIDVQKESVRVDPQYAWGYFDLARFQCASGRFDDARESIELAREKGGPWLIEKMQGDGEFRRLCKRVLE
jgi:hypothetical protein